jgi:hypothetical protein
MRGTKANRAAKPATSKTVQKTSEKMTRFKLIALPTPRGSGNPPEFSAWLATFPQPCKRSMDNPSQTRRTSKPTSFSHSPPTPVIHCAYDLIMIEKA